MGSEDWPSARLRDEVERLQAELEGVKRGLGRPTRDVDGFWEYGVWDRVRGHILRPHDKESALRYVEGLGNPGAPPRYVVVRRWLGGWEAGD